jgi:hypothetical protein
MLNIGGHGHWSLPLDSAKLPKDHNVATTFTLGSAHSRAQVKSFKKAMERLDKHTKEVAHRLLHGQISKSEVAPTMEDVSYPGELNMLLSELYRRLK